jgi:hypothetical protein
MRRLSRTWTQITQWRASRLAAAATTALIVIGGIGAGIQLLLDGGTDVIEGFSLGGPSSGVNGGQLAAFGPARTPYDYLVNSSDCANNAVRYDRCGSGDRAVFNSFVNTPSYGDERPFFDGRRESNSPKRDFDPIENAVPGQRLVLRTYINNDANDEEKNNRCNETEPGVSKGTRVSLLASSTIAMQTVVLSTISAENATSVYDHVTVRSSTPFLLVYVPGSAELLRDNRRVHLSDTIATPTGALVGFHSMDGNFPGCFSAAALVKAKFEVVRPG